MSLSKALSSFTQEKNQNVLMVPTLVYVCFSYTKFHIYTYKIPEKDRRLMSVVMEHGLSDTAAVM